MTDDVGRFHLHLVSDATGETLESIAKAALAQFDMAQPIKHYWPMIRTSRQMERVMDDIVTQPGLVLYTLVDDEIRHSLVRRADAAGLVNVSVLDPIIKALGAFLGKEASHTPGRQHALDADYFNRIDAMHYTMAHDDGNAIDELDQAHIILVGVSRTSKTPTSIYLANRGLRVANIPFVPDAPMPTQLDRPLSALVVGLTTSPDRLIQVRSNRLRSLNETRQTDYTDTERVRAEVRACRRFCADRGWPVIDVTRRSIEESAAAILNLYQSHTPGAGNAER